LNKTIRKRKTGVNSGARCSGRVGSSCFTSVSRRVNLVINLVISHEWGKDREVKSVKTINVLPFQSTWVSMYVFNSVLWCKTNFGENQRGNQKWTFQRHWQHWEHKTQYEDKTQKHKNTILFALSEAHDLLMLFVIYIYMLYLTPLSTMFQLYCGG
jgi:hypothetical protein